jgi:hypothetical protein
MSDELTPSPKPWIRILVGLLALKYLKLGLQDFLKKPRSGLAKLFLKLSNFIKLAKNLLLKTVANAEKRFFLILNIALFYFLLIMSFHEKTPKEAYI